MLDVVRKDPMTPAPAERSSSLRPRVDEPIGVPTPNELPALWLDQKNQLWCRGKDCKYPLGLSFHGQMSLVHPL